LRTCPLGSAAQRGSGRVVAGPKVTPVVEAMGRWLLAIGRAIDNRTPRYSRVGRRVASARLALCSGSHARQPQEHQHGSIEAENLVVI
jgi:hypothetical protein